MRFFFLFVLALALRAAAPPVIHWQAGPRPADLFSGASLRVPAPYVFTDRTETARFLSATGNPPAGNEVMVLAPRDVNWFAVFSLNSFEDLGLKANAPDPESIAQALTAGTQQANTARTRSGQDTLTVVGWQERPRFDAATGKLEWSLNSMESNGRPVTNRFISYLTRTNAISIELVTEPGSARDAKSQLERIVAEGLIIAEEQRYRPPVHPAWWAIGGVVLIGVLVVALQFAR